MFESILKQALPKSTHDTVQWGQLYGSASALALVTAAKVKAGPMLVISKDMAQANDLYYAMQFYAGEDLAISIFPDWETLPYDTFSPHEDIISKRLTTLASLATLQQGVIIAPITTLMHPLMPPEYLAAHSLVLQQGQRFSAQEMRGNLTQAGYNAVQQVMQHGEFAIRGSMMDIFPMGSNTPYRIDLFDDDIETIRIFDPETQRSVEKITEIKLLPGKEFPLTEQSIETFRDNWRTAFNGSPMDCPVYDNISKGVSPSGIEYYLPLFYDNTATLFDYLPAQATVVHCQDNYQAGVDFWQEVETRFEQYGHDVTRPLLKPQLLFTSVEQLFQQCKQYGQIKLHTEALKAGGGNINFPSATCPNVAISAQSKQPLLKLQQVLQTREQRVLFCAESEGRREAILELLNAVALRPKVLASWHEFVDSESALAITTGSVGFGLNLSTPNVLLITEAELYGQRVMQRRLREQKYVDPENAIRSLLELKPGMPVVHIDHGVGRYLGLQTIVTGAISTEFATIEYAEHSKLYVPVANLELLSRYSGGDAEHAPMHRLGAEQWSKAKQKAAQRARDVAAELLDLYARRAAKPGLRFSSPDENYRAFTAAFPFEETPDQSKAIHEVLMDLEQDTPMDRLVCGDVGFGKTEVAMRATFQTVQNGHQVAILVPTTLLAEQHFQNFKDRFANWPIQVELLSRFRTKKQQDLTLQGLASGKVDIVIGTHKLLQQDIQFANLGLLIIDEEHRFGVKQKEKIKALRTDVHILTLTATPIPRTLNMSLSQIRELSLIATPPAKRLSIKTFVNKRNDTVLREAILREVLRGGQVYFLHNNVQTIEKIAREIEELVPEAKVGIGHGQMRERELEQVMSDFYHQRFNVLVCTTIIETGIDVPSANTIIMDRADKLGLAQLHQLRGRVGRSHHQAYAYLLIPDEKVISKDAQKRLEAISEAEDLGSGFLLATHDLEIRGAGELLGGEQSGQIASVGFSLYMEFLDKAVTALKNGEQPDFAKPLIESTEIDLYTSALIPEEYLPDVHHRLVMYKRIANAKDEVALKDLQVEMIDRFGLLPEACKSLFKITELKQKAAALGVKKIQASEKGGFIEFTAKPSIEPVKLIQLMQKYPAVYKLQGASRLNFTSAMTQVASRFDFVGQLLRLLS